MFSQSSGNYLVGFIRLAITWRWLVYSSFQKQFVRLKFLLANPTKVQGDGNPKSRQGILDPALHEMSLSPGFRSRFYQLYWLECVCKSH